MIYYLFIYVFIILYILNAVSVSGSKKLCNSLGQVALLLRRDRAIRDALCLSVVSFNSVIPRAQSFAIVSEASDLPLRTIKIVFGVTFRLFVIHFVVVSRLQQTPPLTSD